MGIINTFTLDQIDPCNPELDRLHIEDIAHALSMTARSGGHFPSFYSVARHCITCAVEAKERGYSERIQVLCLLHDGSEAYLQDITSPVKKNLPEYQKYEKVLQDKIYIKFSSMLPSEEEIKMVYEIDHDMLFSEFKNIMGIELEGEFSPCLTDIDKSFYGFEYDEKKYLDMYFQLTQN